MLSHRGRRGQAGQIINLARECLEIHPEKLVEDGETREAGFTAKTGTRAETGFLSAS